MSVTPCDAGVVWLASYPKSGNTWLRILLSGLVVRDGEPADINALRLPWASVVSREKIEDHTLLDTGLLTDEEIDRLRPHVVDPIVGDAAERCYIKVHDAYRHVDGGAPLLGDPRGRAAIYIVRDPRDVAVSLSFHLGRSIDAAIAFLNKPGATLGSRGHRSPTQVPQLLFDWSGHVASWTEQSEVPVHLLRYEDLSADTTGALRAVAAFLGLDACDRVIAEAVGAADFSKLQRQERKGGFAERPSTATAAFFRSGRAGGWTEALTPEQNAAIVAAHAPMMERFGYR
ncbi:MAG: sulfotransferase domain-containing protein [Pseudomonadota bacterium]